MAFNFGIGDLLAVTNLCWTMYNDCYLVAREAPDDFRQLVNELGSLQIVLRNLRDDMNSDKSFVERLGSNKKVMLKRCVQSCSDTLRKLQAVVVKYRELGINDGLQFWKRLKWVGKQGEITELKSRIMGHCCTISLCMSTIGNSSLARIDASLTKALEYQNTNHDEIDDTTPLVRSKTSPVDSLDREDNGNGINRTFTSSTLMDRDASASPGSSVSGEDVSEVGIRIASDMPVRKMSSPNDKILTTLGMTNERDWRQFSPNSAKFEEGQLRFPRKSLSGQSLLRTEDSCRKDLTPNVATVVHEAMKVLSNIRQRELSVRRLRIKPQDAVHRPSETFKQCFYELAQYEMADRRLNSKDWLRLGTWWLLKAKFNMQFAKRPQLATPSSDPNIPVCQAYLDLLKASWILYDNVLKEDNLGPLQTNESLKLFYNLSDGISEECTRFRSIEIPDQRSLNEMDLDSNIWEHLQPEEETYEGGDLLFPSDNGRWITVELEDAGEEKEEVIFRTFVDAAIGGRRTNVKSKGSPYMLILSTIEGESEPKITICNQSGTLCLTRDFTTEDIVDASDMPTGIDLNKGRIDGSKAFSLNLGKYGHLEVRINIIDADELNMLMHRPAAYFKAVKRREPRQLAKATENLIFKSSVEIVEQLKPSTLKVLSKQHRWTSCDLRVLETTCKDGWRTTRRFVLSASAREERPWCREYFFPLSRIQVSREGLTRQVTLKWSDCGQEKYDQTDGKYNPIYTHVYNDNNPNLAFGLLFRSQAEADTFESTVLHLSFPPIYSWSSGTDKGCVYEIEDCEPKPKSYKAIVLIHKRLSWTYSDLFYTYRDTDYDYDRSILRIRFPQLYYTDYISTHVDKLYKPVEPPHFSHCEKKVNHVPIDFTDETVSQAFMSSLAIDHQLVFSRRANYINTKAPSRFSSAKNNKGAVEIQLWRKGNSVRLVSRWGDSVEERWMSMGVAKDAIDLPKDNNRAMFARVEYEKGRKIDMANMMARDPRDVMDGKKSGPITIAFESVRDREDFNAALHGRQASKVRSNWEELIDM